MNEVTIKGFKVFILEELKSIRLYKSNKGRFLIRTVKLDKDSLHCDIGTIIIPESTMMIISRMFFGGFMEDIKIGEKLDVFQIS